jgi:hypothetical protein
MSKITLKNTNSIKSYHWDKFACDVCKETYPDTILYSNGKQLNITSIEKPKTSYILLESIPEKDIIDKCNTHKNRRRLYCLIGERRESRVRKAEWVAVENRRYDNFKTSCNNTSMQW